ncbi:MAG: TRAP transporter large permease subunit [Calditrichaeota bacterium]|nr:TRAP transporter large permease subunit [Calditrichota bacterium]
MNSEAVINGWLVFGAMLALFLGGLFWRKLPIGAALLLGAVGGALVAGSGLPVRHLVEGMFTYFDPMLIIFTAMFFMRILDENGTLIQIAHWIIRAFIRQPVLLMLVVTFFIMFPAMLTGITTTSVLTTGAIIAPPLIALGMPRAKTGALVAFVSVMGMLAPPINLLVMIIGQGVDMPYIGFTGPLLVITIPIAILGAFILGYGYVRRAKMEDALNILKVEKTNIGFAQFLPLLVVFVLMALVRLLPAMIPDIGVPLIFIIGAVLAITSGRRILVIGAAYRALLAALPVLALLAGVGAFLQIMTLTGARGLLVMTALSLPEAWKYIAMLVSLPLFGGVSAFASGMVFGVPFLLSLLGRSEIIVCVGIAILAGLGDVLPPSAINARFAAQVTGESQFLKVVSKCLPLVIVSALAALTLIVWADAFKGLIW